MKVKKNLLQKLLVIPALLSVGLLVGYGVAPLLGYPTSGDTSVVTLN